ncbi:MAG: DNA recombination protein RmuC [Candidatus Wildermuthbacteria bacterium]|nr:DNA recombination protein RmuC [Candidatus Wildermuthbacteria bacterium]
MIEGILIAMIAVLAITVLFLFFQKNPKNKTEDPSFLMLQSQINELSQALESKLGEGTNRMFQSMNTQFNASQKLVTDIRDLVTKQLTEVTREQTKTNEATVRFVSIAEQLANLEKVLKHQKQRGNLGERSLELILSNILPPGSFSMQYRFPDGATVDAIITTKEGIIPIDAKFSLDNYNRVLSAANDAEREELEKQFKNDLKLRIDETSKYVRPKDGTLPFAFMYIPAEAIYYDLLINEVGSVKVNTRNLIDYAYNEKKVIIVSPTTFAAYLQSVLHGFKAFKIEESAKDIIKNVENLSRHLRAYEDYYKKIGVSLSSTINHYNSGSKELGKIDKDIMRITGEASGIQEPQLLDKPIIAEIKE